MHWGASSGLSVQEVCQRIGGEQMIRECPKHAYWGGSLCAGLNASLGMTVGG